MSIRLLINEDGSPFDEQELEKLVGELDSLSAEERKDLRDANAEAIANHAANQILIVAGRGRAKAPSLRSACCSGSNKIQLPGF